MNATSTIYRLLAGFLFSLSLAGCMTVNNYGVQPTAQSGAQPAQRDVASRDASDCGCRNAQGPVSYYPGPYYPGTYSGGYYPAYPPSTDRYYPQQPYYSPAPYYTPPFYTPNYGYYPPWHPSGSGPSGEGTGSSDHSTSQPGSGSTGGSHDIGGAIDGNAGGPHSVGSGVRRPHQGSTAEHPDATITDETPAGSGLGNEERRPTDVSSADVNAHDVHDTVTRISVHGVGSSEGGGRHGGTSVGSSAHGDTAAAHVGKPEGAHGVGGSVGTATVNRPNDGVSARTRRSQTPPTDQPHSVNSGTSVTGSGAHSVGSTNTGQPASSGTSVTGSGAHSVGSAGTSQPGNAGASTVGHRNDVHAVAGQQDNSNASASDHRNDAHTVSGEQGSGAAAAVSHRSDAHAVVSGTKQSDPRPADTKVSDPKSTDVHAAAGASGSHTGKPAQDAPSNEARSSSVHAVNGGRTTDPAPDKSDKSDARINP